MRPPLRQHALAVRGGGAEPDLHIAGKLFPALRKTVISGEQLSEALAKVLDAAALADLAVIAALWLLADPLLCCWPGSQRGAPRAVGRSFARLWARGLRRLAATMGALYVLVGHPRGADHGRAAGGGRRAAARGVVPLPRLVRAAGLKYKKEALGVYPSREGQSRRAAAGRWVYDRFCDVALAVFVAVVILELSLELGVAFASLVAVWARRPSSSPWPARGCSSTCQRLLLTFSDSSGRATGVLGTSRDGRQLGLVRHQNTSQRRTVVVPNGQIMNAKLINISRQRGASTRRVTVLLEDGRS